MAQFRPAALLAAFGAAAALAACASPPQTSAAAVPAPVMPAPILPGSVAPGPMVPARVVATPLPGSPAAPPPVPASAYRPGLATTAAPPPTFPQHWDGSYQGRSVLVRASSPACPPSRRGVIEIGDSTIFFAYTPETIFTTAVAADGTMHGKAGTAILDGRIANNQLAMTISSPACQTQYTGRYVWNHSYPP